LSSEHKSISDYPNNFSAPYQYISSSTQFTNSTSIPFNNYSSNSYHYSPQNNLSSINQISNPQNNLSNIYQNSNQQNNLSSINQISNPQNNLSNIYQNSNQQNNLSSINQISNPQNNLSNIYQNSNPQNNLSSINQFSNPQNNPKINNEDINNNFDNTTSYLINRNSLIDNINDNPNTIKLNYYHSANESNISNSFSTDPFNVNKVFLNQGDLNTNIHDLKTNSYYVPTNFNHYANKEEPNTLSSIDYNGKIEKNQNEINKELNKEIKNQNQSSINYIADTEKKISPNILKNSDIPFTSVNETQINSQSMKEKNSSIIENKNFYFTKPELEKKPTISPVISSEIYSNSFPAITNNNSDQTNNHIYDNKRQSNNLNKLENEKKNENISLYIKNQINDIENKYANTSINNTYNNDTGIKNKTQSNYVSNGSYNEMITFKDYQTSIASANTLNTKENNYSSNYSYKDYTFENIKPDEKKQIYSTNFNLVKREEDIPKDKVTLHNESSNLQFKVSEEIKNTIEIKKNEINQNSVNRIMPNIKPNEDLVCASSNQNKKKDDLKNENKKLNEKNKIKEEQEKIMESLNSISSISSFHKDFLSEEDFKNLNFELAMKYNKELCGEQIDIISKYIDIGKVLAHMVPGILNNVNPQCRFDAFKILVANIHDWPNDESYFNGVICFLPTANHKEAGEIVKRMNRSNCCCSIF